MLQRSLKGSAHAPPINGVGADCDSQPERKIKRHLPLRSASLAAQQRPLDFPIPNLAENRMSKISRSENMSRIRCKDTSIEISLRSELWKRGYRYRKNDKTVFGKPDIVFKGKKIAVFCDSEFWHGKKYLRGEIPKTNRSFWKKKLERNIERDHEVSQYLLDHGWLVLRFWQNDITKNLQQCVEKIMKAISQR